MKVTIEGQRGKLYEGYYTRQETARLVTLTLNTNYHTVTVRTAHGETVVGIMDDVDEKIKTLFRAIRIEGEKLPGKWETVFEGTVSTSHAARLVHRALQGYETVRVDDQVFDRSYDVPSIRRVLGHCSHSPRTMATVVGIALVVWFGAWTLLEVLS